MSTFELEGWEDINQNGGTVGTGINRAIHKLTVAIFNSGSKTSGQVQHLQDIITQLNKTLKESSQSSDKHSSSMKWLTTSLVFIGFAQIIVAWLPYNQENNLRVIKSDCYAGAELNPEVIKISNTTERTKLTNQYYQDCLNRFGL